MRHLKEFNTGERSIERVSELQAINFGQVIPTLIEEAPSFRATRWGGGNFLQTKCSIFLSPGVRFLCKRSHWAELPPYHSLSGKRLKNALYFSFTCVLHSIMLLVKELLNHFSAVLQHCGLCHKPPYLAGIWDLAMIFGK